MEDSQEARTWWKQWIWVEKLIFPVSVTQKEQLSGVFIFDFEKSAFLAHPNIAESILYVLWFSYWWEIRAICGQYFEILDVNSS